MSSTEVVAAFEAALGPEVTRGDDVAETLEALLAQASLAHPQLAVPWLEFVDHLGALLGAGDASTQLRALRGADLLLAYAASRGDALAVRTIDADIITPLRPLLRRSDTSDDQVLEALQATRMQLLVGIDGRPRLLAYAGRGDLSSWVRVAATRILLNQKRGVAREVQADDLQLAERAEIEDSELARLKHTYRAEFRLSFAEALQSLSPRSRNLLRQHYVDGLTMEQVGALYRVHRITVHRWIDRTREELAAETKRRMAERLRASGPEVESILRLIQSQLDTSLRSLGAGDEPPQGSPPA